MRKSESENNEQTLQNTICEIIKILEKHAAEREKAAGRLAKAISKIINIINWGK